MSILKNFEVFTWRWSYNIKYHAANRVDQEPWQVVQSTLIHLPFFGFMWLQHYSVTSITPSAPVSVIHTKYRISYQNFTEMEISHGLRNISLRNNWHLSFFVSEPLTLELGSGIEEEQVQQVFRHPGYQKQSRQAVPQLLAPRWRKVKA